MLTEDQIRVEALPLTTDVGEAESAKEGAERATQEDPLLIYPDLQVYSHFVEEEQDKATEREVSEESPESSPKQRSALDGVVPVQTYEGARIHTLVTGSAVYPLGIIIMVFVVVSIH